MTWGPLETLTFGPVWELGGSPCQATHIKDGLGDLAGGDLGPGPSDQKQQEVGRKGWNLPSQFNL